MTDMMRACWNWMMSIGWVAMAFGLVLLVLLIALVVALIRQFSGRAS